MRLASIHKAAKAFSIARKRVREWSEKYEELKRHSGGAPGKRRKLTMAREPLSSLQTSINCLVLVLHAIHVHAWLPLFDLARLLVC